MNLVFGSIILKFMKKRPLTLDRFLKAFFPFLKKHGMEEDNIRIYFQTWLKTHPGGSVNDFAWMIFNSLLFEIPKQISTTDPNFYKYQEDVYFQMAVFERKYESKNGNQSWKLMLKAKLNGYLFENECECAIEILTSNDCEHSKQFEGKLFEPIDFLENPPVPNNKCSRSNGCLCFLICIPKRDKNGKLIMKRTKP